MNEHNGYLFILFDIPSTTKKDKKIYTKVLKEIKAKGFIMALKSTYYKFYDNLNNSIYDVTKIKSSLNNVGKMFTMKYTINEFNKIDYLSGDTLPKLDNNIFLC